MVKYVGFWASYIVIFWKQGEDLLIKAMLMKLSLGHRTFTTHFTTVKKLENIPKNKLKLKTLGTTVCFKIIILFIKPLVKMCHYISPSEFQTLEAYVS